VPQRGQHADDRAFACTIGAYQPKGLATLYGEADAIDDDKPPNRLVRSLTSTTQS
jgi:hypothetical protein